MKKYSRKITMIITIALGFTVLSINPVASYKVESDLARPVLLEKTKMEKDRFRFENKRNRKYYQCPPQRRRQAVNFRGLKLTKEQRIEIGKIRRLFRKEVKTLYVTHRENMMGVLTFAQQDTMRIRSEKIKSHRRRRNSRKQRRLWQ